MALNSGQDLGSSGSRPGYDDLRAGLNFITSTILFIYKLRLVVYRNDSTYNEMFSIESIKYHTSCIVLKTRALPYSSSVQVTLWNKDKDPSHVGMVPIKLLNPKLMHFNDTGSNVPIPGGYIYIYNSWGLYIYIYIWYVPWNSQVHINKK